MAKAVTPPPPAAPPKPTLEKEASCVPTLEEMQIRAQHMREQREKIMRQNRANREKELKEFNGVDNASSTKKTGGIHESEKQMTLDLARRLREDIVREATK